MARLRELRLQETHGRRGARVICYAKGAASMDGAFFAH